MSEIDRKIIEELCQEKGIEIENISYDWISILKKDGIERKLVNDKFHLNNKLSVELAKDKYSTYELLKYYDIPVIEHKILFNEKLIPGCEEINQDYKILKNDEKVVIKLNDSSEGNGVFIAQNQAEKLRIVKDLFAEENEAVVVCPYYEIDYEYRCVYLDGEIIYVYKKQKPFVVGDGKSSLKVLIQNKFQYLDEPIENLDLSKVLLAGEKVIVGWKHNLCHGGIPILVDEKDLYYKQVIQIAKNAGKALEMRFATVDVVVTNQKKIMVMEVNSSVTVNKFCELVPNGYAVKKMIFSKVLDRIFEEKGK